MITEIERITHEINELRRKEHLHQVDTASAVGLRLVKAQGLLDEGQWTHWRRNEIRLGSRTAARLIAIARFQEARPETFRQLSILGLNKLYRIAELPERFLRRLTPQTILKIPGTPFRKSLEEMGPVELNCCVRSWTHRVSQRRPNQAAQMSTRLADKLHTALERLAPRMDRVKVGLRNSLRSTLEILESAMRSCLRILKRTSPAA